MKAKLAGRRYRDVVRPITLNQVLDAQSAARRDTSPVAWTAARGWLAGCPMLRSAYESEQAWYLAQQAAETFRPSAGATSSGVQQLP